MQMALYVFLQTIKPYIEYSISSQTEKSKADETIESAKSTFPTVALWNCGQ